MTAHDDTQAQRDELIDSLDDFTRQYLETALWSSTECDEDGSMGAPLDEDHDLESFDLESLQSAIKDCRDFQESNADDLKAYAAVRDIESAGHDFWLNRNGHGAGFWDRGLGELGERLSKASKVYGGVDLMAFEGVVSGS